MVRILILNWVLLILIRTKNIWLLGKLIDLIILIILIERIYGYWVYWIYLGYLSNMCYWNSRYWRIHKPRVAQRAPSQPGTLRASSTAWDSRVLSRDGTR